MYAKMENEDPTLIKPLNRNLLATNTFEEGLCGPGVDPGVGTWWGPGGA